MMYGHFSKIERSWNVKIIRKKIRFVYLFHILLYVLFCYITFQVAHFIHLRLSNVWVGAFQMKVNTEKMLRTDGINKVQFPLPFSDYLVFQWSGILISMLSLVLIVSKSTIESDAKQLFLRCNISWALYLKWPFLWFILKWYFHITSIINFIKQSVE